MSAMADDKEPDDASAEPASLVSAAPGLGRYFWEKQDDVPALRYIQHAARAHMVSPEALLFAILSRLSSLVPYGSVVDTKIGSPTPLNILVAIIGGSSAGKSSAVAVARKLVPAPPEMPYFDGPIGSGEGLVENLLGYVDGERKQVIHNAHATVDEGQVMGDIAKRAGSILMPTMRSIFSGGQIGQANASKDTRRIAEAGSYAYGVTLLLQPAFACTLLDGADGGDPQRYLFASAWDSDAPDVPPKWPLPPYLVPDWGTYLPCPITFEVDDAVLAHLRNTRLAALRGETDVAPMDGHLNLIRLRVAALFSLMRQWPGPESMPYILEVDWELAGTVVEYSCEIRDLLIEDYKRHEAAEDRRLGVRAGRRAVASDSAYVRATAHRILDIQSSRHPKGWTWTSVEIKKRLGRKQREVFDEAMALIEKEKS